MRFVSVFVVVAMLVTGVSGLALAEEPRGSELPPGIDEDAPKSIELVVPGRTKSGDADSYCDTLWWHGLTDIFWTGEYGNHYSQSRDEPNHWYPCDIDKIGVRGRLWVNDILVDEEPMRYSLNASDKNAQTYDANSDCDDDLVYARSNHYFQHSGTPTWQPQTDDTC